MFTSITTIEIIPDWQNAILEAMSFRQRIASCETRGKTDDSTQFKMTLRSDRLKIEDLEWNAPHLYFWSRSQIKLWQSRIFIWYLMSNFFLSEKFSLPRKEELERSTNFGYSIENMSNRVLKWRNFGSLISMILSAFWSGSDFPTYNPKFTRKMDKIDLFFWGGGAYDKSKIDFELQIWNSFFKWTKGLQ